MRAVYVEKRMHGSHGGWLSDQQLYQELHMEGYCDKNGFPREITKLNNFDPFIIIQRTNNLLLSFVKFYVNFVKNPRTQLSRWVYLIRFSCLKTLALKYRTTLKQVFKKFKTCKNEKTDSIEDTVVINLNGVKFSKTWKLHTIQTLLRECENKGQEMRRREIEDRFRKLENNIPIEFEEKRKNLFVSDTNYREEINWMDIRPRTNFYLSCCICDSGKNVRMRFLQHSRITKYIEIDKEKTLEQVVELNNRKQIPICKFCHVNIVYLGNYKSVFFENSFGKKMYDESVFNKKRYAHKSKLNIDYEKYLIDKGWKFISKENK